MSRATTKTPKSLQFKMKQEGGGESSFRVLYYGDASAGSVPFMWESHPGTPKHDPTTTCTHHHDLPPLTPPPAFRSNSSNISTSLRTLFLAPTSDSSTSYDSSSKPSTSLRSLFLDSGPQQADMTTATTPMYSFISHSTPMSKGSGKTETRRRRAMVIEDKSDERHVGGEGSPTSTLCFGGGLMKIYRKKKGKGALMSIGSHGKTQIKVD